MKIIDGNLKPAFSRGLLRRLLDRLFAYESMSGSGLCPVYLERWTLCNRWEHALYLHHFIGDDWALDPHDHPRRFVSVGLWGWYWEDTFRRITPDQLTHRTRRYRAPWIRSFPAEHLHRIRAKECGNCLTLVLVLPKSRAWGFVRAGRWVPFKDYVFGGKSRKAC